VGASDLGGRLLASLGQGGPADSRFVPCADVPKAGVLLALPALLASGLWRHSEKHFSLPDGYYQLVHLFILVAFLALARIKTLEGLRHCAPGEWGKVLGLDRVPEVRTLREKIRLLGAEAVKVGQWAADLSRSWMEEDPESAGTLYVDGHVRVYHGSQTRLPRHYVARQRLCLRATTDYWINAQDGKPFFVVHRPVDPGLLKTLEEEIVPRLERDVPGQPSAESLAANPDQDRFILVFDREGYSPDAFQRLRQRSIGCLTYNKHPGPDWPAAEFQAHKVRLVMGTESEMMLASRPLQLTNGMNVREVRKLEPDGRQISVIDTTRSLDLKGVARCMFARWTQENFLKYMREHFALDRLVSYLIEPMDETTLVVNPDWRKLDGQIRSLRTKLSLRQSRLGKIAFKESIEPESARQYLNQKAALQEEIRRWEEELAEAKNRRQAMPRHRPLGQLPKEDQFQRLACGSKDLVDTIKLIAYRAETAMANIVREAWPESCGDEARRFLQGLYLSEADLIPDEAAGTLRVRMHYPASGHQATALAWLCEELTATETVFPTTKLRLIYEMISPLRSATLPI